MIELVDLDKQNRAKVVSFLEKHNINSDKVDIVAFFDSSLSLSENLSNIAKRLNIPSEVDVKGLEEKARQQARERAEEHAEQEFGKAISLIAKNTTPQLKKYFGKIEAFVDIVVKGHSNSLLLLGSTGLGKTTTVLNTLLNSDLRQGEDFVYLNSHLTPLKLYETLYLNRGKKVIVIDDVPLSDENFVSILKGALYGFNGKRFVQYNSSSEKLQVPSEFELEAGVIFCCNAMPDNPNLEALKSRCLYYVVEFDYFTRLKILAEMTKLPYKNLSYEERKGVFGFIKENSKPFTRELNFRTLTKFYEIYCYDKKNWKGLAIEFLDYDEDMLLVDKLQRHFKTGKERVEEFVKETGKSRRTYYYAKAKLGKRVQKCKVCRYA